MKISALFSVALLLFISLAASMRVLCGRQCKFRLCKSNEFNNLHNVGHKHFLPAAGSVYQPYICTPAGDIGRRVLVGEPMEQTRTGIVTLKSQGFPGRFFRGRQIPALKFTGITRKSTSPELFRSLAEKCIILPIKRYQKINEDGSMTSMKGGDAEDCVSFRVRAARLQIYVFWESDDNIDLSVREPNGNLVSAVSPRTATGLHRSDNNIRLCGKVLIGKEETIWNPTFMPGEYCATLTMRDNCKRGRIKYDLRFVLDGVTLATFKGRTDADDLTTFRTECVTVPASV